MTVVQSIRGEARVHDPLHQFVNCAIGRRAEQDVRVFVEFVDQVEQAHDGLRLPGAGRAVDQ